MKGLNCNKKQTGAEIKFWYLTLVNISTELNCQSFCSEVEQKHATAWKYSAI